MGGSTKFPTSAMLFTMFTVSSKASTACTAPAGRYNSSPGPTMPVPLGFPIGTGIVGPGELLYLPAGAVHAVDALEDTVNIVNNIADVGNLVEPSAVMESFGATITGFLGG